MKLECFCEMPPLAFTNPWKCLVPSSSICVCIDEMMLILIGPFDSYANMCRFFGGGGSSNTQSNLIVPYYWESFSVPMCLTQTHWYSLSRSFSTSTGGEVSDGKRGHLLMPPANNPLPHMWRVMPGHNSSHAYHRAPNSKWRFCLRLHVFVAMHFKHLSCDIIHEPVYPCESGHTTSFHIGF